MANGHISRFRATGIGGCDVVDITPKSNTIEINGENGAGKSIILRIIKALLEGGNLPVRNGKVKGEAEIEFEKFTIKKVFKLGKTPHLTIKPKPGIKMDTSSPAKLLRQLLGPMGLSPASFASASSKEQKQMVFDAYGIDVTKYDTLIENAKLERSKLNKEKKELEVYIEKTEPSGYKEPVEIADLQEQLKKTNALIAERDRLKNEFNSRVAKINTHKEEVGRLKKRIEEEEQDIATLTQEATAVKEKYLEAIGNGATQETVDEIIEKINNATEINEGIKSDKELKAKLVRYSAVGAEISSKLKEMKAAEKDKTNAVSVLPEGLTVEEDGVYYNGVPTFGDSLCGYEKQLVGCKILKAQNPAAKIILMDNVSTIDTNNLKKMLDDMPGYQWWLVFNGPTINSSYTITEGVYTEGNDEPVGSIGIEESETKATPPEAKKPTASEVISGVLDEMVDEVVAEPELEPEEKPETSDDVFDGFDLGVL